MKLFDLRVLFRAVAFVEAFYAISCVVTPPSLVLSVLGWNLSADGQWVAKLLGLSLGLQAAVAWLLRRSPPASIAWVFGLYQMGAATVDWVMWALLHDQGIFQVRSTQLTVMASIPTHYALGLLLLVGAARTQRHASST